MSEAEGAPEPRWPSPSAWSLPSGYSNDMSSMLSLYDLLLRMYCALRSFSYS